MATAVHPPNEMTTGLAAAATNAAVPSDAAADAAPDPDPSVVDPLYDRLRSEALRASSSEPSMSCLLSRTILHPSVHTFEGAVASTVSHRLALACGADPDVCPDALRTLFEEALSDPDAIEFGHTAGEAVRADAMAHVDRDPACETVLEAVLFFKGYAAVVSHRVSRRQWYAGARFSALWIQSQASSAFGVDIHPAASIGCGVMIDHATGVVVGETAVIGDGCTLLHGVTLGGTGKDSGDRHPKVGRDVLIGANASVLGNIKIGDGAKIGAGSVVLRPVPHGATAVGSPAKIIGWAKERDPGSNIDQLLVDVVQAGHGGKGGGAKAAAAAAGAAPSLRTDSTASLTTVESGASLSQMEEVSRSGSGSEEEEEEGSEEADGEARKEEGEEEEGPEEGTEKAEEEAPPLPPEEAEPPLAEKGAPSPPPSPPPPPPPLPRPLEHEVRFHEILPEGPRQRSASYPLDGGSPTEPTAADGIQTTKDRADSDDRRHKTLEDLPDYDCCSPFRDFRLRHAPPGCVTYCSLRALLRSAEGGEPCSKVTDDEVGEVFWELLRRTGRPERRYVPRRTFEECFAEVAGGFTGLGAERCRELLERAQARVGEGCGGGPAKGHRKAPSSPSKSKAKCDKGKGRSRTEEGDGGVVA